MFLLTLLALSPYASAQTQPVPEPHDAERYESLWLSPLFSQPPPPEVMPAAPVTNPDGIYRLLGMGVTADGTELAYVQPAKGGNIDEVSRNTRSGPVLLGVERRADGRVDAVTFRQGGQVIRAVASSAVPPDGPGGQRNVPSNAVGQAPARNEGSQSVRLSSRLKSRALTIPARK